MREAAKRTLERKKERMPVCPCCGEECECVFENDFGEIVGCENCIVRLDAWMTPECRPWEYRDEQKN